MWLIFSYLFCIVANIKGVSKKVSISGCCHEHPEQHFWEFLSSEITIRGTENCNGPLSLETLIYFPGTKFNKRNNAKHKQMNTFLRHPLPNSELLNKRLVCQTNLDLVHFIAGVQKHTYLRNQVVYKILRSWS